MFDYPIAKIVAKFAFSIFVFFNYPDHTDHLKSFKSETSLSPTSAVLISLSVATVVYLSFVFLFLGWKSYSVRKRKVNRKNHCNFLICLAIFTSVFLETD